jgi:hypothetical protein
MMGITLELKLGLISNNSSLVNKGLFYSFKMFLALGHLKIARRSCIGKGYMTKKSSSYLNGFRNAEGLYMT